MVRLTLAADCMTAVSGLTEWWGFGHGVLGQTTVGETIFSAADPGWGAKTAHRQLRPPTDS
jgi:hypothetical protein